MPEDRRKLKVFICHSSQDKPDVRDLYRRLCAEEWIDAWLDEEKLYPGQDWNFEIEKAVEEADAILVCLTKKSVNKEGYVQRELRIVLDLADYKPEGTLFLIPVRLEECEPPRRLRNWQYADYFPLANRDRAYERLMVSLRLRASQSAVSIVNPFEETARRKAEELAHRQAQEKHQRETEERKRKDAEIFAQRQAEELNRERKVYLVPLEELSFRSKPVIDPSTLLRRIPVTETLICVEPANQAIPKVGVTGQWLKVRDASNKEGYVAAWYVKYASGSQPAPANPAAATAAKRASAFGGPLKVKSTAEGIAFRKQPVVSDSTLVARYPIGTEFTVLESDAENKIGKNDVWLRVRAPNGKEGYVAAWFVAR